MRKVRPINCPAVNVNVVGSLWVGAGDPNLVLSLVPAVWR